MRRTPLMLAFSGLFLACLAAVLPLGPAQSAADECRTAFFLGARGSGQKTVEGEGYGKEVLRARNLLARELPADWLGSEPLLSPGYPARGTELLYPNATQLALIAAGRKARALELYASNVNSYLSGMSSGVDAAINRLEQRAAACPTERIVLSGYSQGAMVMHRALVRLERKGRTDILGRVDGVILFADGDRAADMTAKIYGRDVADRGGQGLTEVVPVTRQAPIPASVRPFVYQRCASGDLVCDFLGADGLSEFRHAISVHGTYDVDEGLDQIARAVANTIERPERPRTFQILRDPGGTAYLVDPAGSRRWIPDGMTWGCQTARGTVVTTQDQSTSVGTYPDEAGWWYCFDQSTATDRIVTYIGADSGGYRRDSTYWVDGTGRRTRILDTATAFCRSGRGATGTTTIWSQYLDRLTNGGDDRCFDAAFFRNRIVTTALGGRWFVDGDGRKHPIPTDAMQNCFKAHGYPEDRVVVLPYLDRLPIAATANCIDGTTARYKMLRAPEGDIHYIAADGLRHWVPDDATLLCRQAAGVPMLDVTRDDINVIGEGGWDNCFDLNVFKGRILRHQETGAAYLVDSDGAARHWIPDELTWMCRTEEQGVSVVNARRDNYFTAIPEGGWDNCFDIDVVRNRIMRNTENGVSFFVGDDNQRHWVPDSATWDCRMARNTRVVGYRRSNYESDVTEGGWDYCYEPSIFRGKVLSHSDGDSHYIHPDDTRTWIPDEFTYDCRMRQGKPVVNTRWRQYVTNHRETGWDWCFDIETFKGKVIEHPSGDIHFVDQRGVRHWVSTYGDRDCLRDTRGMAPRTVRWREYINNIPEGEWAICGDTMRTGMKLDRGQWLRSTDGRYNLHMQTDGNFVAYNSAGRAIWATNRTGNYVVVQGDGNLVQYGDRGAVWATNTVGSGANRLVMQSDGNIVLYNAANRAVWASNTVGR
ncbi:cutinase family protein [Nocardioides aquiterrae]|uniref:Bulb-type lectin domain-containing protein n=1 Tax=Nocardioides aquiterrae TaxID=203799 RepID=A0ABN1UQV0_9ACTN